MKLSVVLKKLDAAIKTADTIMGHVAGFSILLITGIVSYEVFFRYVLNRPPIWAFDICSYLLLLIAVFSGVYTMEQDKHVSFTFVVENLRQKPKAIVLGVGFAFGLIYCICLLRESILLALLSAERNIYTFAQVRIPSVYLYLVIVIGAFFLLLTYVIKAIFDIFYSIRKK